jgi:hypothetical protein
MSNRRKIVLLAVLGLVLLLALYRGNKTPEIAPVVSSADDFRPIAVDNPALRLDLLDRLKKLQYSGSRRNIFASSAPPPVTAAAPPPVIAPMPSTPAAPAGPPPLVIPATFYGYVTDSVTGMRRAFFMEGENVYVLGVGEVLLERYRLVQIGNSSAELEEISSGRRATLTMEEPNPS